MKHSPTDQQLHIVDLLTKTDDNICVDSLAGTAKTYTLRFMDEATNGKIPAIYIVFNKRNKEEALEPDEDTSEPKFKYLDEYTIKTFNGLGHSIWGNTVGSISFDDRKIYKLFNEAVKELSKADQNEAWACYSNITSAIGMAKSLGYVPDGKYPNGKRLIDSQTFFARLDETPTSLERRLINNILLTSIKTAYKGFIDYGDQIYMPAVFGGAFPDYPLVYVDEAQDLNPTNHALLQRLVKGRIVAVGDPWQSIYAFRGAVQGGMARLAERFNMTHAELTVSFRCPQVIVQSVWWHTPQLRWSKPGGLYGRDISPTLSSIPDNACIICRNNAPLFKLALHLLAAHRSVRIAGSDIGPKITKIMSKLGPPEMSTQELLNAIEEWRAQKLAKSSTTANDVADCLQVFASFGNNLGTAIAYAEHMFRQQGSIQLITGHKSKGLEWDFIYHLDPWLIGEHDQERNLRYVITTRSKHTMIEIDSKDVRP
jgi:hypothetical protein